MTDPRPRTPEAIIREVFARVRAGDPSAADLYAHDAVVTTQQGQRHEGFPAIAAFYRHVVENLKPQPHVETLYVNLPTVAAVIRAGDTDLRVLDVFTVVDGEIKELRICPPSP